jgi:hypothetical protein
MWCYSIGKNAITILDLIEKMLEYITVYPMNYTGLTYKPFPLSSLKKMFAAYVVKGC